MIAVNLVKCYCFMIVHLNEMKRLCLIAFRSRSSSSVYACLILVHIPLSWSMPARWTPSKTSTYTLATRQTARSQHEPTFTVVPTGDRRGSASVARELLHWCSRMSFTFTKLPNVWLFLSASCVNFCSFLCRSVAVESSNRVAVFQLSHRTDIRLQTSTASFLLVRATAKDSDSVSQHLM